jgi:hypothetical protein
MLGEVNGVLLSAEILDRRCSVLYAHARMGFRDGLRYLARVDRTLIVEIQRSKVLDYLE